MPRDITITFSDGTKHQYNNTPDSVTPDDIEKRAKKDYPNKKISNISGGKKKPAGDPLSADPISANARPKGSAEPVKKKDELDQVKKNAGVTSNVGSRREEAIKLFMTRAEYIYHARNLQTRSATLNELKSKMKSSGGILVIDTAIVDFAYSFPPKHLEKSEFLNLVHNQLVKDLNVT